MLHLIELATLCIEDIRHLSISVHDDTLDARSTCIGKDNASSLCSRSIYYTLLCSIEVGTLRLQD